MYLNAHKAKYPSWLPTTHTHVSPKGNLIHNLSADKRILVLVWPGARQNHQKSSQWGAQEFKEVSSSGSAVGRQNQSSISAKKEPSIPRRPSVPGEK